MLWPLAAIKHVFIVLSMNDSASYANPAVWFPVKDWSLLELRMPSYCLLFTGICDWCGCDSPEPTNRPQSMHYK